jgi:hypothetical protein
LRHRLRDRPRRAGGAAPGATSPSVSAGLLNLAYYSAVTGKAITDEAAAARDLVRHGMPDRLSPHPRIDLVSLPAAIQTRWRERRAARL